MAQRTVTQKLFIRVSAILFLGSTLLGAVRLYNTAAIEPALISDAPTVPTLEQQEQGYETVLKREPNNQSALEGLVETRLQLHNPKSAAVPLQKLIQLYPDRQDYVRQLQQVKQQASDRQSGQP
jgi:cytochrome c-type biogenesis protein CcmH/NrfG